MRMWGHGTMGIDWHEHWNAAQLCDRIMIVTYCYLITISIRVLLTLYFSDPCNDHAGPATASRDC